jgi:internalin A
VEASEKMKTIFISYSHADKKWLSELRKFLKPLERTNQVSLWDDSIIQPGDTWKDEISRALANAKVALLLVTQDFIASDLIHLKELPPLLEGAKTRGV